MKPAVLFGLAAVGTADLPAPTGKSQINDEDRIAQINSANGLTWVAGHNDFFNGMTFDDARTLLGSIDSDISEHMHNTLPQSVYDTLGQAPSHFDATTKWANLTHPIRNQLQCGSCWAFSASEAMSDRVAIASGKPSPVLSAEDLVSCDKGDMACRGGYNPHAWEYIQNPGLVTDACFPYGAGRGIVPKCPQTCVDGSAFSRTKARKIYAINGIENMQKEMMTHGPIQVSFEVYSSFYNYRTGVYAKLPGFDKLHGGHAVKMVGWGAATQMAPDYWKIANSWGPSWGEDGYFRIKRGVNECYIETRGPPYAGLPDLVPASTIAAAPIDLKCDLCRTLVTDVIAETFVECNAACQKTGDFGETCVKLCNVVSTDCKGKLNCVEKACEAVKLCPASNSTAVIV